MQRVLKDLEESISEQSGSDDEESKEQQPLRARETERQGFIYSRVQQMSDADYKQFILCR